VLQSWTTTPTTPGSLQQVAGFFSTATTRLFTIRNASKHIQLDQDAGGSRGTPGNPQLQVGYQLNRVSNDIFQHWNAPDVQLYPGQQAFTPGGSTGRDELRSFRPRTYGNCTGSFGYSQRRGPGFVRKAVSYNHSFFATGRIAHQLFAGYLVAEAGEISCCAKPSSADDGAGAKLPNGVADIGPPGDEVALFLTEGSRA